MHAAPTKVTLAQMAFSYLSIPLLFGAILLDMAFFNGAIRKWLPVHPESWVPWVLIFGMPHVLASWQPFADKDYLDHYGRRRIALFVSFFVVGTMILWNFNPQILFAVFVASIIHHTIAQQYGIAMAVIGQGPTLLYRLWKWSMVLAGVGLYVMLYFSSSFDLMGVPYRIEFNQWFTYTRYAAEGLTVFSLICGALYYIKSARGRNLSKKAWIYLAGTLAMGPMFTLMFDLGYFAFVIILGRLIHEGAAWFIYITHDRNRSNAGGKNVIYRFLSFTRIPVPLLTPLVAFGIGVPMGMLALESRLFWAVTLSFSLIHYWMEGVIWKRGHIHREYLGFASA